MIERLDNERTSLVGAAKDRHELLLKEAKEEAEAQFNLEKSKIEADFEAQLQAQREKLVFKTEKLHTNLY